MKLLNASALLIASMAFAVACGYAEQAGGDGSSSSTPSATPAADTGGAAADAGAPAEATTSVKIAVEGMT